MTTVTTEAPRPAVVEESARGQGPPVLGKAPVHILLVVVGLLWLVPTIGLFLTSLFSAEDVNDVAGGRSSRSRAWRRSRTTRTSSTTSRSARRS